MLRKEQNDLLTQTGPETPMGRLFRSYWVPALLREELPQNDCPPVRVKLLSERLIAFRDTNGHYGLMDEFCAHRGISLWFGRNEACGLRCHSASDQRQPRVRMQLASSCTVSHAQRSRSAAGVTLSLLLRLIRTRELDCDCMGPTDFRRFVCAIPVCGR